MQQKDLVIRNLQASKIWDYENGFWQFAPVNRIAKAIAQFELYRMTITLPGVVAEFGTYKGASLMRLAGYREILETPAARPIYAFDAFGEFPKSNIASEDDQTFIQDFENAGGGGYDCSEMEKLLQHKNMDNVFLIKGDVRKTIFDFLAEKPEIRFSFVHLDLDVYEPTRAVLGAVYDRVVGGGVVMIDDYGFVEGATRAVDEFIKQNRQLRLHKLSYAHRPAYIVVDS